MFSGLSDSGSLAWRRAACLAVVAFVALLQSVAPAQDVRLAQDTTPKYRKQWAIVIGINYADREDARIEGLRTLANAEADAKAIAELLIAHYGYAEDTVKLLTGTDATKTAIEGLFGKRFLRNPQMVNEEDSVLVFFAGHGDRETSNDRTKAFLYPHDVQTIDGLGIDDATCVKIDYLVNELQLCPARHRLIILDSCHSGEVFRFATTRSAARYSVDRELFKHDVVQAMAAARAFQEAEDAVRGETRGDGAADPATAAHSPFTTALLEALNGGIQAPSFGASVLFSRIPERVKELASTQRPQGGTLSGEGEFYFFRQGEFILPPTAGVPNFVFQTLPGLHGNWWFEEVPWLIPSLRGEPEMQSMVPATVVARKVLPSGESAPAEIPRDGLFQPRAMDVYEQVRTSSQKYVQQWSSAQRLAFQRLQDLSAADMDEAEIDRLLSTFDSLDDLHFRAVVHHRFNQPDAEQLYREAIAAYEKDGPKVVGTPRDQSGLYRLCLSDFGRFMFDTGFAEDAAGYFRLARHVDGGEVVSPFLAIHTMIWESAARAKQGEWKAADELLLAAKNLAQQTLAPEHPLLAAVHDRAAWIEMDRWRLDDAIGHFETAIAIRQQNGADDMTTRIALYHNRHGLAMAQRFQGRFEEARQGYQQLRADLTLEAFETASRHQAEIISQRLVNTLERLGDCYLYTTPGLPYEAYGVYDEAIEKCSQLSPHQQYRTRARLICKAATAMALAGDPESAVQKLEDAQASDFSLLVGKQAEEIQLFRDVTSALCLLHQGQAEAGCDALRALLVRSQEQAETIERQQLEVLLFAGDQLLAATSDEHAQSDADLMLKVVPDEFINPTNLPYLRPYYDAALEVKLRRTNPFTLRKLTRTIMKAKTGSRQASLPPAATSVVFYLGDESGYAIVTPKSGGMLRPEVIPLNFGTQTLAAAELPDPLVKWLGEDAPTVVHWRDTGVHPALSNDQYPFPLSATTTLVAD